jgi:N-acetyl-gamma-glutamyl-phosphate reductase
MSVQIFIDGAAGTTGLQIAERLAGRTDLSLLTLDAERRKDPAARANALNAADIAILCLPDEAAREAVALIRNDRTRVIDASTAHRIAPGWTYGLPEVVGRAAVVEARRVSNPGCYPTGFVAIMAPLVRAGIVPADWPLSVNAVSGYSGGGKAMIAEYEAGPAPAWRSYALGLDHKHLGEMKHQAGLSAPPIFAPAVVPLYSGMVVEVPLPLARLPGRPSAEAVRDAWRSFYAGSPVVSVPAWEGATLAADRLAGSDRLELFAFADQDDGVARLVAVLDNLGKGASGAAVQSLNLMAGLPETAGLRL